MKFVRRPNREVEINLTALIDVVFLLLIFFMVSTTFTRESRLMIELPKANPDTVDAGDEALEVLVTEEGGFAVNGVTVTGRDLDALRSAIEQVAGGETSRPLTISADASAPHQSVVTAMDAAGQLGFTRLGIATLSAEEEP